MNTKFFGQYLLEKGIISRDQLLNALDAQRKSSPLLGDIAVEQGWITQTQANKINTEQRKQDKRFGEIAIGLTLLDAKQIETVLHIQQSKRKFFGEILIELNYASAQTVNEQLIKHKHDAHQLNESIELSLNDSGLNQQTRLICEVFSRFYPRMMKISTAISNISTNEPNDKSGTFYWSQTIQGDKHYELVLSMKAEHACKIASKFLNFELTELNELSTDALSEFLNTFTGHVYDKLGENTQPNVLPPKSLNQLSELALSSCTCIDFDSGEHQLSLILGLKS